MPSSVSGQHITPSRPASGVVQQKKEPRSVAMLGVCTSRTSGTRLIPLYSADGGCIAPYAPGGPSSILPSSGCVSIVAA